MLNKIYKVDVASDFLTFEFESIGPKGRFTKVVNYTELDEKGFYNLGFGDKDPETGLISDATVTDNGDSQKVLATVAATLYTFTEEFPNAFIVATGSTSARTRLYRIGISNNLETIKQDFTVFGLRYNEWEIFRKDTSYDAFLVKKKL